MDWMRPFSEITFKCKPYGHRERSQCNQVGVVHDGGDPNNHRTGNRIAERFGLKKEQDKNAQNGCKNIGHRLE